jgi:hypothetical protein
VGAISAVKRRSMPAYRGAHTQDRHGCASEQCSYSCAQLAHRWFQVGFLAAWVARLMMLYGMRVGVS